LLLGAGPAYRRLIQPVLADNVIALEEVPGLMTG